MRFMIILKVIKNQGFTFSIEDTISEKPQEGEGEFKLLLAFNRWTWLLLTCSETIYIVLKQ